MKRNLLTVLFAAMLFLAGQYAMAQSQCDGQDQGAGFKCATSMTCEAVKAAITVDGDEKDWKAVATEYTIKNCSSGADMVTGAADCQGKMKVSYDDTKLYVLINVSDDAEVVCGECSDVWMWDNIEIFFNAKFDNDDTDAGTYGDDAQQLRIRRGHDDKFDAGKMSTTQGEDVDWIQQNTADGWMIEASFTWVGIMREDVGVPEIIGYEISIGDADVDATAPDAGTRESIVTWANDTGADQSWLDTRCFGYLKTKAGAVDPGTAVKSANAAKFSVSPNPVKDVLTIANANGKVQITDVTGKLVMDVKNTASELKINVSNLSKGVYFVKNGNQSFKVVKK